MENSKLFVVYVKADSEKPAPRTYVASSWSSISSILDELDAVQVSIVPEFVEIINV